KPGMENHVRSLGTKTRYELMYGRLQNSAYLGCMSPSWNPKFSLYLCILDIKLCLLYYISLSSAPNKISFEHMTISKFLAKKYMSGAPRGTNENSLFHAIASPKDNIFRLEFFPGG